MDTGAAHRATVSDEQHVTWLELFFDLVFVAWLSLVNASLLETERPSLLLGFDATFVAFTIWMLVSVLNNRYPDGGLLRTLAMVLIMLLILVTALTVQPDDGLRNFLGAVMIGAVYCTCAVLLIDVRRQVPGARLTAPAVLCLLAAAICWLGAPTVGEDTGELYNLGFVAVSATVLGAVALLLLAVDRTIPGFPLRPGHLDERWGQVVIIVLGEGFLVLAEVLLGKSVIPNPWLFVVMFVAMFGFWRLYFDSAMRAPVEESAQVFAVLAGCHLLLILGLLTSFDFLAQGVGIELSVGDDYLLGGAALGLVFATLAAIAYVRRGRAEPVVLVNAGLALAFVAWGVVGEAGLVTLTAFIAVCLLFVLVYAAMVRFIDPLARPMRGTRGA